MAGSKATTTLANVVSKAISSRLNDVHTAKVGRVTKVDLDKGLLDVLPVVRRTYNVGDDLVSTEELPTIMSVPILWPRAGKYVITFPIQVGDHVALVFTDDDISGWRDTGTLSDPNELGRMRLGSCWAQVGFGAGDDDVLSAAMSSARKAGMVVGADGGPDVITFTGDSIVAGFPAAAAVPVALAPTTDARLTALEAAVAALGGMAVTALTTLGNHTHPVSTTGTAAAQTGTAEAMPSPPAVPTPPAPTGPTTGSTMLKAIP